MICHVGQCSMCFLNVFWCKIIYTRCSIARGGIPSLVIMGDPVCTANVVVVVFDTKKKHLCKKNSIKKTLGCFANYTCLCWNFFELPSSITYLLIQSSEIWWSCLIKWTVKWTNKNAAKFVIFLAYKKLPTWGFVL